jgi:thiol-disulfide isomerase/thioredoxin
VKNSTLTVLVATGCAVAGFLSYRYATRPSVTTPTVAAVEAPKAEAGSGTADEQSVPATRAVPETVPDLKLPDVDGKSHALKEYSGAPRIINFWATWCAPCRREIPLLNELQKRYQSDRLRVLGIAVDLREAVAEYTKTTHFNYPLLMGEKEGAEAAARFGMEVVLPFSIFVDAQDRVIAVKVGELHPEEADVILDNMRQLASGKLALADARARIDERLKQLAVQRAQKSAQSG